MSVIENEIEQQSDADRAARKVMTLMLLTFKNFTLYPESHTICINCIRKLKGALNDFFSVGATFKCGVEQDRLLFQGEPLYQHADETPGENLPGILYRDGLRWIEFQPDIEIFELNRFFSILQAYRFLDDEPEGDLVTALWEADLDHIGYDAVLYWEVEPLSRFPSLETVGQPLQDTRELMEVSEHQGPQWPGEGSSPMVLWQLNEEEIDRLQRMIAQEEEWDAAHDVLNVLLDILEEQHEPQDFSVVLEFMEEEYLNGLGHREFSFSARLITQMERVRQQFATDHSWAIPHLNAFFQKISSPEAAEAIRRSLMADARPLSDAALKAFTEMVHHLSPDMVPLLAPMMVETRSPKLQRALMEGIASLLSRDLEPVERLLKSESEDLIRMTVHILGYLKGESVNRLLLRMTRHSAAGVRKQALKSLIKRSPDRVESFFFLIDDPDVSIRRLLLNHLRKRRPASAEPLLLDYLKAERCVPHGREHILACFSALGDCASSSAVPFLRETLLNRLWSGLLGGNHAHIKEGAARALAALNLEEAREVLQTASQSLAPHIRKISRMVMKERYGR
ncbi:MAG: HEAT repeat domain-containing protein [Thermodesulfobacteriota bacterium]